MGAALIEAGRLLAACRREPPELAGRWELPGGKVEVGESDEDALVRECREELGVFVRLVERVGADWPLPRGRVLRVWTARLHTGEPRPLADHSELRWLGPDALYAVPWLAPDLPIVAELSAYVRASAAGRDPRRP